MTEICNDYKKMIIAYLNDELNDKQETELLEHTDRCDSCTKEFDRARELKNRLNHSSYRDDILPQNFDVSLHRKLTQYQYTQREEKGFFTRFFMPGAFAGVALILLMISGVFFFQKTADQVVEEGTLISQSEVSAGEPVTIELTYHAKENISNVAVSIRLDNGVSFYSDKKEIKDKKILTWQGDLVTGENMVPFAVEVSKPGEFSIETEAVYGGYKHRHRVILTSDGLRVAVKYYKLPLTAVSYES